MRRCMAGIGLLLSVFSSTAAKAVPVVRPEVIRSYPHDPRAFTQGLLTYQGKLFESTGQLGRSSLRRVDLESGKVEKSHRLADELFGEGLARVDEQLFQLTWRNGRAMVYSVSTFEAVKTFAYQGEGWGLCFDGSDLVMSNGSAELLFRDPRTFETQRRLLVEKSGAAVARLNELECVGELVYANVWLTDRIMRIDKSTGQVLTDIDASGLLTPSEAKVAGVLNGIAYDSERDHFFLTGKDWPKLFEVKLPFSSGRATSKVKESLSVKSADSAEVPAHAPDSTPEVLRSRHPAATCGCGVVGWSNATMPPAWLALGSVLFLHALGRCHRRGASTQPR